VNKTNWFSTGALLAASIGLVAQSAAGDSSLAGVRACRALADAVARLACYDRETDALDAASAPPAARAEPPVISGTPAAGKITASATAPAPVAPPAPVAFPAPVAPVLNAQQRFGLPDGAVAAQEVAAGARAADVPKIEAHLVRVSSAADSRLIFTLDNQQVWRQVRPEGELLAKVGDAVTVRRGVLGSYWLQFPSGRGCKVSRVL
jgi:hypothetical protein